jgi:hypothetical protein
MMQTPTEFELQHLLARDPGYDPAKAHAYYERHKHLKGRRKGATQRPLKPRPRAAVALKGRKNAQRPRSTRAHESPAKARQRKELSARIESLSKKLQQLEALIRKKEHEAQAEDRKGKAKKERAAKEKAKPKSAAEKAKAARENKQFRDKHKQELKTKAKKQDAHKSGGSSKTKKLTAKSPVSELKVLATKVKGQIAVAKQKLAAL